MRLLLDTNVCIAAMRGRIEIVTRLAALTPEECFVSTITVYELFTGAAKSQLPAVLHVVTFDEDAARHAARVRSDLEKRGKVCGPYDLLLAGHALALGIPIVTHNVRELSRVSGLQVLNWMA